MRFLEHFLFSLSLIQILGQYSLLPIALRHGNNILIQTLTYYVLVREGIRLCQVPALLTSNLVSFIAIFDTTIGFKLKILNLMGFVLSIFLRVCFGPGDFSRIKIQGPYAVGFRQYHVEKSGNAVSVFYPINT